MRSKYNLLPHCKLVVGASGRGAIYDLRTGNIYSVNEIAVQIILGKQLDRQGYWITLSKSGLAASEENDISQEYTSTTSFED